MIEENKESKEVIFEKLLAEYKQACKVLNYYGVSNERAKTLVNGIDVLTTRFRKETNCLLQEYPVKIEAEFKTFEQTLGDDKVYITFSVDKSSPLIPALLSNIRNDCKICISSKTKEPDFSNGGGGGPGKESKVSNVGQDGSKINKPNFTGSDGSKISRYF